MGVYCYGIRNKPVEVMAAGELIKVYPLVYLFKPWSEFWSAFQYGDKNVSYGTRKQVQAYDRVIRNFQKMKANGADVKYVAVADRNGKIQPGTAVFRVTNPVFPGIWWDDYDPGQPVGVFAPATRRGEKAVLAAIYVHPKSSVYFQLEDNKWAAYITRVEFDGTHVREERIPFQTAYPGASLVRYPPLPQS